MANNRYSVTVYIAGSNAPTVNEDGTPGTSSVGHMWLSLDDNQTGMKQSYGFHPSLDGRFYTKAGKVKTDDLHTYPNPEYQTSIPITESQYRQLSQFCENARSTNSFGSYFGLSNACIDFTWTALSNINFGKYIMSSNGRITRNENIEGHVWPTHNIPLVEEAKHYYMETCLG